MSGDDRSRGPDVPTGRQHERAPRDAGSGEPDADASRRAVPKSDQRPAWNLLGPRRGPWLRRNAGPRRCACAPSCAVAQTHREWTYGRRQQLHRARLRGPVPSTWRPPRSRRPQPCPRRWWPSPQRRTGGSCGHESVRGRRPAHAGQKTTRFITCLALARSCAGLLSLTQLVS